MVHKDIFFRATGEAYSHPPRDRGTEPGGSISKEADVLSKQLAGVARTAYYVILANRQGITPDASFRMPRELFIQQQAINYTILLSDERGAKLDIVGKTTGPYAAGENEYHGLLLVTSKQGGPLPTYGNITLEEHRNLHAVYKKILSFFEVSFPNNRSYIGLSFSPLENRRRTIVYDPISGLNQEILFPRSPVQNLATIHAHLVSVSDRELHNNPRSDKQFDRRMLREPMLPYMTNLFEELIYNRVIDQFPDVKHMLYKASARDQYYPKGALLEVSRDVFSSDRFADLLHALHQEAERVYMHLADQIVVASDLFDGKVSLRQDRKERVRLYIEQFLPGASSSTKKFVSWLADRPDPEQMVFPAMDFAQHAKVAESFILLGLAYNIVYYIPNNKPESIVVAIHPRFISGASPTETMGIFKDQQTVSTAEFQPIYERSRRVTDKLVQWVEASR